MSQRKNAKNKQRPYTVAITGGIASGKTLISKEFERLGVPVIDTDVIAHELVEPGQPALEEIESAFGPSFIDQSGHLKRRKLRTLIFSDTDKRKTLEAILHPKIKQTANAAISRTCAPYCIIVIPLLTSRMDYPKVDCVLVVDVDPKIQIKRLMSRDSSSQKHAEQALDSQISREQRLLIADDILDNSGSRQQARLEVEQLHLKYKNLANGQ